MKRAGWIIVWGLPLAMASGGAASADAPRQPVTPATTPSSASVKSKASKPAVAVATSTSTSPEDDQVTLHFPDNVPLKLLIDYVSTRLGVNILYDEQVGNKQVTIKAPTKVPVASLMGVLESALKMKGLVIVDAEQPGWKRIVVAQNLPAVALPPGEAAHAAAASPVVQIFRLQHVSAQKADQMIKPFLTPTASNTLALHDGKTLIVTDYAGNLSRVASLITTIDRPGAAVEVRFVAVKNLEAQQAAQQLTQVLTAKQKAQSQGPVGVAASGSNVEILTDARTNQLIFVGSASQITDASDLLKSIDSPLGLTTKVFSFHTASAERADRLVKQLIGDLAAKQLYKSAVDRDSNLLIVSSTPEILKQVASVKSDLDTQTATPEQSPIRFYKLQNATAGDVLETIRAIEGEQATGSSGSSAGPTSALPTQPSGPNRPPGIAGEPAPPPPMLRSPYAGGGLIGGAGGAPGFPGGGGGGLPGVNAATPEQPGTAAPSAPTKSFSFELNGQRARVVADPNTNTIIVVGDPGIQHVYEQLIQSLDRRRPQVLVEATVVTLDAQDSLNLGVEISTMARFGHNAQAINLSHFGLSTVDANTGNLALTPGLGFNGAVLMPDIADVIIHALKSDTRARVVSAPQILVNDNSTGELTSVAEEPFTSVNASTTVATTSFAGFAQAGTTITVTPHISQGDYLQLEYTVELNSFTGAPTDGIPPPRQTNSVKSKAMIPDGGTIIVGGLRHKEKSTTIDRVPILGEVPWLEYLFSNRSIADNDKAMFVFLRPIILRDDDFHDLKFISGREVAAAQIKGDYPTSEPMLIR